MKKALLLFFITLLYIDSYSQILDPINPQFKGNVKTAHYKVYFGAVDDSFASQYDGNIILEFKYHFDKNGTLTQITEIQQAGDCSFAFTLENAKIKNFEQKLWNGNVLQKGTVSWNNNTYEVEKKDIRGIHVKEFYIINPKAEISKRRIDYFHKNELSKSIIFEMMSSTENETKYQIKEMIPNHNNGVECILNITDKKYDKTGNIVSYTSKKSCSASYEKHETEFTYW